MKKQISVVLSVVTVLCLHILARAQDDADIWKELDAQYKKLADAHDRKDLKAILALKTSDFHTFFPDGRIGDSKLMEVYSRNFLERNQPPFNQRFTIQKLTVSQNKLIAVAEVLQELARYRDLEGKRRNVETSVVQREIWAKTPEGWKLKSVDNVRDQKTFVDGKRVDPTKPYNPADPPFNPDDTGAKSPESASLILDGRLTEGRRAGETRRGVAQSTSLIFLPQEQEIELALSAGPEHLRAEATVYVFGKKGYEKIRSGTNSFTCMVNRDGNQAGDNDLKPTCWDAEGSATIVPVMLRVGKLLAEGRTADEIRDAIEGGFSEGRFSSPRKAGIAYMLRGDVQYDPQSKGIRKTLFPPHYMIYAPGVTNADIGMNMDAYKKHPSLPLVYAGYSGGARTAYIIVIAAQDKAHTH